MKSEISIGEFCEAMKSGKIRHSPMRRPSLPPDLEARARKVWQALGSANVASFEEFERNFCCDSNVENEIFIWESFVIILAEYKQHYKKVDVKRTIEELCLISMGGRLKDRKHKKLVEIWEKHKPKNMYEGLTLVVKDKK